MAEEWNDVSFVISSEYRTAAVQRLSTGPATPSQIATDADVSFEHVSRALQGLQDQELIELLVSENQKGRVYGLSEDGREVWQTIQRENMVPNRTT